MKQIVGSVYSAAKLRTMKEKSLQSIRHLCHLQDVILRDPLIITTGTEVIVSN